MCAYIEEFSKRETRACNWEVDLRKEEEGSGRCVCWICAFMDEFSKCCGHVERRGEGK